MAEWSRETLWRQGHALSDKTIDKFGLRCQEAPERTVVIVISHDCDLAASPNKEPNVELIVGRRVNKADGNYTHAKTARVLHVGFATEDGEQVVELVAAQKSTMPKVDLADQTPSEELSLRTGERSILQRWLAARYRRAAFPDAFEKRLSDSGATKGLSNILRPVGKYIPAIYFDLDSGAEVQRTTPEDVYTLIVVVLYATQPDIKQSEAEALKIKEQIETMFRDLFFKNNAWYQIELQECMIVSDEALSYAQSVVLKQWRLEHLSLREEPQQPMAEQ